MPILENLPLAHKGKVRETYDLPGYPDLMLVVATDAISTHNVVHKNIIPYKGEVLTALTVHNIRLLEKAGFKTHLVASGKEIYGYPPGSPDEYPADLWKIGLIVNRLDMIPVEFIWRPRFAGSLEKLYAEGLPDPYELDLPDGLQLMDECHPPLFTPTAKSDTDPPLVARRVALDHPEAVNLTYDVTVLMAAHFKALGITLADTKYECGFDLGGNLVMGDEILTPDSSRFCMTKDVIIGKNPKWWDKQFVRDYAEKTWGNGPKVPLVLPDEVIRETSNLYLDITDKVCGCSLAEFQETM